MMDHTPKPFLAAALVVCLAGTAAVGRAGAQTWIELATEGTPPDLAVETKTVHYDAGTNRLIVFFPGNSGGTGNQVWVLANANGLGGQPVWTRLDAAGTPPSSNFFESVVYDAASNRLIVYGGCGGFCSPALSGVFVLTNANGLGGPPVWSQSAVTNPQQRDHHSAVLDSTSNRMIAFGGAFASFGGDQNDVRVLSNANSLATPSTWTTLSTAGGPPLVREGHKAVYDEATNRMIVFAGQQAKGCCPYNFVDYNDVWVLSEANGLAGVPTWTELMPAGPPPIPRSEAAMVYDLAHDRLLVFGGVSWSNATQTNTPLGDLWELSHASGLGGDPEWTPLSQSGALPGPRFWTSAAFDVANQRMMLLGGFNYVDYTNNNRVWVLVFNQAPTALCQDRTAAANESCVGDADVDNGSFDPDGAIAGIDATPAPPYGLGETAVSLIVTDDQGATDECAATVTVIDAAGPLVACDPQQVVECTSPAGAQATVSAQATDNCGLASTSCPVSGTFALGTTPVTCSATDQSGNTSTCETGVTVVDTRPPTIDCPASQTIECTSPHGGTASFAATARDACGVASASCPESGQTFPLGSTASTCRATDEVGLTNACQTRITVVDTRPPAGRCVPSVNPSGANVPRASRVNEDGFYRVSATDTCTVQPTIALGPYPLAHGETIKITQTPGMSGVQLVNTMGPLQIKHFQVGMGDAAITVTDGAGNTASVSCLVPPPPK